MGSGKPNVLYIGDRESFFSREVLRGVFSMRSEGFDWDFWCLAAEVTMQEIRACLSTCEVDGIIARGLDEDKAHELDSLEVPTIFIRGAEDSSSKYINGPHPDDQAIGRLAGEEFSYLNLGYWGFVHWDGVMWSEARKKSFHSYATSLGVSNETLSLPSNVRSNWDGVEAIANWIKSLPKPCGILACKDEAGMDVLHACRVLGLKVPDEVAVISVDNDRLICDSTSPSLTSIDLRAADLGKAALVQLAEILGVLPDNFDSADKSLSKASAVLVKRESSLRRDRYNIIYQKALDYMDVYSLSNLSIADLAKKCGVSRRGLERAFEKCAQNSPAAVMREKRMDSVLQLLKDKKASLESIAHQAGFSEPAGLSNFVKRMTGRTPGELRDL